MARPSALTPDQKQVLLAAYARYKTVRGPRAVGVSRWQAARYLKRVGAEYAPIVAQQVELVQSTARSVYDTRKALEQNYQRLLALCAETEALPVTAHNVTTLTGMYREIREHIKTAMELEKLLVDVDAIRVFQQSVIEAIGEADEATKQRIITKLRERRAIGLPAERAKE